MNDREALLKLLKRFNLEPELSQLMGNQYKYISLSPNDTDIHNGHLDQGEPFIEATFEFDDNGKFVKLWL